MSEKPETEEFDEEESDDAVVDSDDLDLDHLIDDIDKRKKATVKPGEPAWRRLERYREERQTAELLSDFDDYEIGDPDGGMTRRKKR
jgi:Ni/Co efflux regulator RcnB